MSLAELRRAVVRGALIGAGVALILRALGAQAGPRELAELRHRVADALEGRR